MPLEPRLAAAVAPALAAGVQCATATRRQMHELLRVHAALNRAAGRDVWETARVLPWDAMLRQAWIDSDGRAEALLDEGAATRLWELIVGASDAGSGLIDPRGAARAARRSYVLAMNHALDLNSLEAQTAEQAAFLGWAASYEAFLADGGYLDRACLAQALLGQGLPFDAQPLRLQGLLPLAPAQARLVAHWQGLGRDIAPVLAPVPQARTSALHFRTVEEELAGCIGWVHARLSANPDARLAVLWPDLKDHAGALRRMLDDQLYPAALRPGAPPERPYALGSVPPLASYGCVQAALALLGLGDASVATATLGLVLRSPYVGGAQGEADARARLDARLRRDGAVELPAGDLATRYAAAGVVQFKALHERLRAALGHGGERALDAWAVAFGQALAAAGWPGERALASDEYQTVEKFQSALAELAALARVLGPRPLSGALAELAAITRGMEFQPESGEPSVVFLDGPAAVGYPLDGLWVAGLEASRFPAMLQPDPFLPLAAQRAAGMPGAEQGAGRTQALRLAGEWRAWSSELVLSVAAFDGKTEQRPSPLLRGVEAGVPAPPLAPYAARIRAAARLEPAPSPVLPPLAPGERIPGGTGVLEDQSKCPFRSALRWRLKVRELEQPAPGIAPTLRGKLAHAALASLWRELETSHALAQLSRVARDALVARAIDSAFATTPDAPRGRLAGLERAWLGLAIARQLDTDAGRLPFTVIETESERHFEFDGHVLDVRLDRLDRQDDGRTVLIDYKTGRGLRKRWFDERLQDLQLPLYASHLAQPPAAIANAHLPLAARPYAGLASGSDLLPGVAPAPGTRDDPQRGYDALIARWRAQTDGLAGEFVAGVATVAPAPGACDYCRHGLVCRIVLDPGDLDTGGADDDATD